MRLLSIANLRYLLAGFCVCWCVAQTNPPSQGQGNLATISAGPATGIVPPPPDYHFPDGQAYVYSVEWHLFTAGSARVSLQADGGQQHVIATAVSTGVVNALYRVNDRFEAFFDPHTFCSLKVSKHIEEGSHARQSELHFDHAHGKSVLDEKNLKTGETKHVENDIPPCVSDVVSGFYYLASLPLQSGNSNTFQVNDGGKTTEVTAHVEAREQVKVPAGVFHTVRVRVEAISGAMKGKGTVWSWFTDDANHTPVQMRSKLGWGTLLFRLQRVEKQ
ncbi:MAG: DUF3108 domain-containing protein [Terriglobales bacterium]